MIVTVQPAYKVQRFDFISDVKSVFVCSNQNQPFTRSVKSVLVQDQFSSDQIVDLSSEVIVKVVLSIIIPSLRKPHLNNVCAGL